MQKRFVCIVLYYCLILLIGCDSLKDENVNNKLGKAIDYESKGDFRKALFEIDGVLNIDSNNLDALLLKGILQIKMDEYKPGITTLKEVIRIDTTNTSALFNIGVAYLFLEDYKSSVIFLNRALKTKENNGFYLDQNTQNPFLPKNYDIKYIEVIYWRGYAYYYQDFVSSSLKDFERCISENYNKSECYLYQGFNYIKLNDLNNACKYFNLSINEGNKEAISYNNKYCQNE